MSAAGVQPNPHKVDAVSKYPTPTNTKELKHFLGLTNYYPKFICNYAFIAKLLNKLLRGHKNPSFGLTLASKHLTILNDISYPWVSRFCYSVSDASDTAIGAVLSQFKIIRKLSLATGAASYPNQRETIPL